MTAYLSRRYQLSASHRLFRDDLSEQENTRLFGKCANPHGHGHNYQVEVTVGGSVDRSTGMVCDLSALDACVQQSILAEYNHKNLNLHPDFDDLVPTTENFSVLVYQRLAERLAPIELAQVRIEETSNNAFVYAGIQPPLEAIFLTKAAERLRSRRREEKQNEPTT